MKCKVSIIKILIFTILLTSATQAKVYKNIHIYISKISNSMPIKQFSLTQLELNKLQKLKGIQESLFLSTAIAKRLFKIYQYEPWDKLIYLKFKYSWCGKCKKNKGAIIRIIYLKKQNIILKIKANL